MLFILLWGSLLASCAGAADLYVAQKDPAANDKNPGTEALPFKTIQPATDAAGPGDTIWVKAGLYQDRVHITKCGRLCLPNIPSALIPKHLQSLPEAGL